MHFERRLLKVRGQIKGERLDELLPRSVVSLTSGGRATTEAFVNRLSHVTSIKLLALAY